MRNINEADYLSLKTSQEKIKFFLQYAILAPSTHNSQPWKFRVLEDSCELHRDIEKLLPEADPTGKNMCVSLGCCIENLVTASNYFDTHKEVIYHKPKSNRDTLVAIIKFKNLTKKNSFKISYRDTFLAIQRRTTHRGIYTQKKIDKRILSTVFEECTGKLVETKIVTEKAQIKKISEYTKDTIGNLYGGKAFRGEFSKWINNNFSKKREGIPGYSLKFSNVVSLIVPLLLKYVNISKLIGLINYKSLISMPAICVVSSKEESERAYLEVGRMAERIMLRLTAQNIDIYITVAAVDIDSSRKKIISLIHSKYSPQFLFGFGYSASKKIFTPRIPVENKII